MFLKWFSVLPLFSLVIVAPILSLNISIVPVMFPTSASLAVVVASVGLLVALLVIVKAVRRRLIIISALFLLSTVVTSFFSPIIFVSVKVVSPLTRVVLL